ncbi:transglutaminase domain-containing protein [Actinotalea sp. BY-33]|uniref:Transglutaminase domain-containing protein n=1 Tax=Actinotalea soli TaxID=2819234 RepID=A0A939LW63_9CELL|nr:DUF3488 and transglutaminase-like domain-containing protein [Actinotalea soli]MBO1753274.1 transglutaminase domain-containing protein [Actinotalea soli]
MTRSRPAVTGTRAWLGAAVLSVAVLTGVATLDGLLAPGPWLALSALLVVSLTAAAAAIRSRSTSRLAPTGWTSLLALAVLWILYAGPGTGPTASLPTAPSLRRLTGLAEGGVGSIADGVMPLVADRGVELLVVTGAVVVALLADLLALALGRAGLAGVALLGLWAPAAVFEQSPSGWVLLVGGVAFLVLLSLTGGRQRRGAREPRRTAGPTVLVAAGVTVLALVVSPLATAAPWFNTVRLPSTWGPPAIDGPLRLSTDLDMRSSLAPRSDRPILTYTTDSATPSPLRMFTMDAFDGTEWRRGEAPEEVTGLEGVLWPTSPPSSAADEEGTDGFRITVGDLDQDRLPIPLEPREVQIAGPWAYDPSRDEVVTDGPTTRDSTYVVRTSARDLSPETLRRDAAVGEDPSSPHLWVPESPFTAEITALAVEVTAGSSTTYDQALALQSYFRDAGNFRYDTQVPEARTDDAVWDFLTDRTGYCVQYATAMTVMARSLGIPSRLAVGFLPGRASGTPGEYVVTGRQSHAWPELHFAGAGWVRFEPTPATQTGPPPAYADPFLAEEPTEVEEPDAPEAEVETEPEEAPGEAESPAAGGEVSVGATRVPVALVLGLALLVGAGFVSLLVARRRRRRGPAPPLDAETAWATLRERLAAHGVEWSAATTPRQAAETVRSSWDLLPGSVALRRAEEGLALLLSATEEQRYGPDPVVVAASDLEAALDDVLAGWAPAETRQAERSPVR